MLLQLDARNPKELAVAEEIRRDILEFLPLVLEAPHFPPLTADEKQTIHLKLAFLRTQETRASYFGNVAGISYLRPGTVEAPTKLTPQLMRWAGRRGMPKYKEPKQQIPGAKNGRILKTGKGL